MHSPDPLDIRPAVADALQSGRAIVAMVSSPLTHTLPWPNNVEALKHVEGAVHKEGAILAFVAVWKGKLTVGLESHEVESLCRGPDTRRASRRDLAAAILGGWTAGTTVSAAMYVAYRAGIRTLVTGSIGTARPFVGQSADMWDISSDLVELSRTPVAVVCSGSRSASRATYAAEVLETFRVPVVGYRTDHFPNFYMSVGSNPVSSRVDSAGEAASLLKVHWGIDGAGIVLAQNTPKDVAISPDELLPALRGVEIQAEKDGVARKDFSPFLMDKLNRWTGGKALRAYAAILAANGSLAAQVARELLPSAVGK